MSFSDQYNDVISGLLEKSREKKVVWNTTTEDEAFIVCFKKYNLIVKEKYSQDYSGNVIENYISIFLINNLGERIDSFSVEPEDIDWKIISELHTLARRSALCIDDAISEMLTELKKDGVIGNIKKNENTNDDGFSDDIPF